jgi:hypothetical protein
MDGEPADRDTGGEAEPLEVEHLAHDCPIEERFPGRRELAAGEGFVVWAAENSAGAYLIEDERSLVALFPEVESEPLLRVLRFGSARARDAYARRLEQ